MNNTENSLLTKLGTGIDPGTLNQVRHILNNLSPPDIAHQLETAPPRSRDVLWQLVDQRLPVKFFRSSPMIFSKNFSTRWTALKLPR